MEYNLYRYFYVDQSLFWFYCECVVQKILSAVIGRQIFLKKYTYWALIINNYYLVEKTCRPLL